MKCALIIDDNEDVAMILKIYLTSFNLETTIICNDLDSIKFYKKNFNKYNVICIDYMMPNINGIGLFYKFYKINSNIKALIHSGGIKPQELTKQIDGLYGFIKKPFEKEKIEKILIKMEV